MIKLSRLKSLGVSSLNALFPAQCVSCSSLLTGTTSLSPLLCGPCFSTLDFIRDPKCERCGMHTAISLVGGYCPSCGEGGVVESLSQSKGALIYQGSTTNLIKAFKHGDRLELADRFAGWMLEAGQDLVDRADYLVPIPLNWRRLVRRRYNQAAILAQAIADKSGSTWRSDLLVRSKFVATQKDQSAEQRFLNLEGAFSINHKKRDQVKGASILLIDDVRTTGATLQSAAATLMDAGAHQVNGLVLALVPPKNGLYIQEPLDPNADPDQEFFDGQS